MNKQISVCPKCNDMHGWYEMHVTSGQQYFHADGTASHYVDDYTHGGGVKFCYECGTNITNRIGELPK